MAREARLMLGPRDGEVVTIVEAKPTIEIMLSPAGRHVAADDVVEYDVAVYTLDRNIAPGVFRYNYSHLKDSKEEEHDID